MTALFRRINPAQKFRITKRQIAQFLRISESLIVKVESWLYVIFVHRLDKIRLKCLEAISPEIPPVAKAQGYASLLTCDRVLISCG